VDELGGAPGNYRNGVTLGAVGALAGDTNRAARFDGSNDVIGMSDPTSGVLDFGTGDFTAEAWVKATADNERAIISKRVFFSSQPYWEVTVSDDGGHKGEVRATVYNGTVTRQAYGPAIRVDKDGLWHHVVVLFDRDFGITVYVDGVSRTTTGTFTGNISNSGELLVGKSTSLFVPYFKGDLDEVALYGKLLSAGRIQAHRAAGL
jgi:Concanavalin A-like lectin/glucanases superfamily